MLSSPELLSKARCEAIKKGDLITQVHPQNNTVPSYSY